MEIGLEFCTCPAVEGRAGVKVEERRAVLERVVRVEEGGTFGESGSEELVDPV